MLPTNHSRPCRRATVMYSPGFPPSTRVSSQVAGAALMKSKSLLALVGLRIVGNHLQAALEDGVERERVRARAHHHGLPVARLELLRG